MTAKITCKDLYNFLAEYLDGNLPEDQMHLTKMHLEHCPCCKHYLENYQEAVDLGRSACTGEFGEDTPVEVPEKLVQAILAARKKD